MSSVIQVRCSRDGGRNWDDWREFDLGETGQFDGQALWWQFGQAQDLIFEVKQTSPYRGDWIAASIITS